MFPYIVMIIPDLKAIHNDPEYPLLLHHLNDTSKILTTIDLIQKMSCLRPYEHFLETIGFA